MLQKCASGSVGGARPCQGRGRGFESRLALFLFYSGNPFIFMRVSAIFVTGHSYTFSFSREYFTMIQKVSSFLKKDTVLTIALALAVLSMFIIPPSAGYLGYLDLHTLILLFGLMTATTGLQNIGFFRQLGELLLLRIHSLRQLEQLLILLCFFSSMLITNDVALITFVPFALELLRMVNRKDRIVPVCGIK